MLLKVKILDTNYNEKHHLVFWKIKRLDTEQEISLALKADELVQGLLNNPNVKVTPKEIIEFNSNMIGKEINWDSENVSSSFDKDFSDMTESELLNWDENINATSFPEVSAILDEESR